MKVAFIGQKGIPASWGGVEDFVEQTSIRLAQRGHRVTVYCRPYYTSLDQEYNGVRLQKLPSLKTKYTDALSHTLFSSLHALFQDYDIIHYQALGPAALSFLPRIFSKSKIVATIHSLDWKRDKWGSIGQRLFRWGEAPAVKSPQGVTVVSSGLQNYLHEKYGIEAERIFTGVPPPNFRPPYRLKEFGLQPGKYLLFLGRLVPEKGCHYLCEAFQKIDSDVKLFIAGEGQFADDYLNSLKNFASEKIIFGGYVDNPFKEELLSHCLAFVLPSLVEGFPHTILEAFSYGKAVLASDIPENREALGPFQLTFRSGERDDLARALKDLIKAEPSPNGLPQKRMEYVQKHFSWDNTVTQMEKVYQKLLNK